MAWLNCYHAEFYRSGSNSVRISSGEPAKLGSARATPPWDGGCGQCPNQVPPHMCHHAAVARSALKGAGTNTGEPQKLGSAGALPLCDGGVGDP